MTINELKFNDNLDSLIEEPINYWKTYTDIPQNIINFINDVSCSIPIFNKNKFYCSVCLNEINFKHICTKCSKKISLNKALNIEDINEIKKFKHSIYYYIFDVKGNNILLYLLEECVNYDNPLSYYPYKNIKINIKDVYQIFPKKIIDIKNNKQISYKKLDEIFEKMSNDDINSEEFDIYETFELNNHEFQYLYVDNLDDLKNTDIYKYSNIWKLKNYFKHNYFNLSSLIFYPIYYKEFEYLLNLGFYNLAVNSCFLIKYKGSFKKTFGVDKKYHQFMKNIDIDFMQLEAFKLYPTTNLELLNFISNNFHMAELILKYTTLDKVLNYLNDQGLNINNLYEYGDYIRCSLKLNLNLKENKMLFPKHFIEKHDKITSEIIVLKNAKIDKRIKTLSNIYRLNKYEDDKYIIFSADSVNSLIDESSQQSNCVRTYCDMVANNECQIYFMRYKNNIKKSFVTIEVRDGKVTQVKTKLNKEPDYEIINIIKKWEQTLIPINNIEK